MLHSPWKNNCFLQHQTNCHCSSCDTTWKICLMSSLLALNSKWKFDCCRVGHHCHTIATVPCILTMVECCLHSPLQYNVHHWLAPLRYHVVIACSLTIQCENCIIIACSLQYDINNTIVIIAMLVACILAIWQKKISMSLLLAIGQKYALASDRVKAESLHESKATSQQLSVWRAFLTSFFWGKFFETSSILAEKVQRGKKLVR